METTYKVQGMTCGGCEKSVVRAVSAAAPGATVRASHERGTLVVEGPHEPDRVKQSVEDAGFDFAGAQSP